jgi:hypothetical protein
MGNGQGVPVAYEEYTNEAHEQRLAQARAKAQGLQQVASTAKGEGQGHSSLPSIANRQKGNYELNHPSAYAHGLATLDELMGRLQAMLGGRTKNASIVSYLSFPLFCLPGINREAVKYKNELDAKTHYLGKKLQEQANEVYNLNTLPC